MSLQTSDSVTYLDFTGTTSWDVTKLGNSNFKIKVLDVIQGSTASRVYLDHIFARVSSSNNELYAATSPLTYVWSLTSSNTWTRIIDTQYSTESSINSMVMVGSTLYGSTSPSGVLVKRGTGGGANTWVLAVSPPSPQKITTLLTDGTTIYGGSTPNGLLYKTTGVSWSPVVSNQYSGESSILCLNFDSTGNRVEAGTDSNGYLLGVLKTQSGGSWTKDADITIAGTQTRIPSLAVYDGKLYLGTYPNGLLYEWDGVNAWIQRTVALASGTSINTLAVHNGNLYGGTSLGSLLEWTTGDSAWDQAAAPYGSETAINALVSYNNRLYGASSPGGRLLEWNSVSRVWVGKTYILGSETNISSLAVYNGKLYGGTAPSGLLYEWDGATKWVKMANSLNSQVNIPSLVVFNSRLYGITKSNGYLFEFSDIGDRIIPNFFTGSENKWVYVNIIFDYTQNKVTVYRNGTLLPVSLSTPNIVRPSITPRYLGGFIVSGFSYNTYDGYIDEYRIHNSPVDAVWINQCYNNQLSSESYTSKGAEESIFFKIRVHVTGTNGPIVGATTSGTLVYCTTSGTTPSYGLLYSDPEITDEKGEAEVEFRGYTSDTPTYFILMRAERSGISCVDYYASPSTLAEPPLGVFVSNYDNGEFTIAHKRDFATFSNSTPVAYNATFVLPSGNDYYRSVDLESDGYISPGNPGVVQLQETKESVGALIVFYKTSTNVYGLAYAPWGVSALGLEATFGAPIKDATNVITKTKVVNLGPFTYEVRAEIWTSHR